MKKLFYFCLCAIMFITSQREVYGQFPLRSHNFDTDILMLRNSVAPDFRHHYDDYTQYGPAAIMIGLKACGYDGRSSWGRMIVSDAFSAASMAILVNGIKYSVQRLRPDGSTHNSFPSGHTATAFMTATMLHKEYEGRSPWFSIGGYVLAAITGVSRVLNNRHWMSDVVAGAAIGIGSVHLGYFITDKIFKDKHLNPNYTKEKIFYDSSIKHYSADLLFGRRFILGSKKSKMAGATPLRGSMVGVNLEIPIIPEIGICTRATASELIYDSGLGTDLYVINAGGYWGLHFAGILELQTRAMVGWARMGKDNLMNLTAGANLGLIASNNFKIKAFADFESISAAPGKSWVNTITTGLSAGFYW